MRAERVSRGRGSGLGRAALALNGALLAVLAGPGLAQATDYYVRTSGNDGASGLSPASAWATVEHAADTAVAGDVVYIGAGTYTDGADVQNSGTAASPIRFVADLDGSQTGDAGVVTIDDGGDVFDIDGEDYVEVVGVRVTGGNKGFKLKNAVGIVIEDCEATGNNEGLEIDNADVEIRGCEVSGNLRDGLDIRGNSVVAAEDLVSSGNTRAGIRTANNSQLTINRCDLSSNGREGMHLHGSVQVVNCVIASNVEEGIQVHNNASVVNVWHATIVQNGTDGFWLDNGTATVTNSILAFNGDDGFDDDQSALTHSENVVHGNAGGNYEGTAAGPGEINANPQFLGGGDYHLQPTSPGVDSGIDASAVTSVDRDGTPRPGGAGWDMGAYERPGFHFEIDHDGFGDHCAPEDVAIRVHDFAHTVQSGHTGTVTLSTSTGNGDWSLVSGTGTLVNMGGGSATYTFVAADGGSVQLALANTNNETLNIDAAQGFIRELPSEDPDLTFSGATVVDSFRDEFSAVSWANQDGTLLWSGPWLEVDGAGAGPAVGNARITGGELVLEDFANTNLDTGVQRQADLTGYSSATFRFDFRTSFGVDASDAVFVEVSGNGGSSWSVLERITGLSGALTSSRSYDISAWMASNTRVRIRVDGLNGTGGTSCCYGAANEEFIVDDLEIEVVSPAACGPEHFAIDHDGSGIHCQAESVTVSAHDSADGIDTTYLGTINLTTSTGHGDWSVISGAGAFVNAGGGAATYTFAAADLGQVVLGLLDTFTETVDIDVSDGLAIEDPGEDPALGFESAGFSFLADGVGSGIGLQIGGKPSNEAPGAQALELEAIRTSDSSGACEAALRGPTGVELAFSCLDPTTCSGRLLNVNGVDLPGTNFGSPLSYTSVPFDFGSDSDTTAPFVMSLPEVGRIQLHARYALAPSGESLQGSSNAFVERPFALEVTAPGNLGANGPTGPIFTVAGADFTAQVRAVLWQAADDGNDDGVADGHADLDPANNAALADNLVALAFGQETAAERVRLAASLVQPGGGFDPGLGGTVLVTPFSAGSGSEIVRWDEVGIIELVGVVDDGNYLGIGAPATSAVLGRSSYVGRFTPDHFDVAVDTAPIFQTGCDAGGFSYVGQPFGFAQAPVLEVTARSALNTQTRNYTGLGWWKLTNASLGGPVYVSAPAGLDLSGLPGPAFDPAIMDLGDGTGTLTFGAGTGLFFTRAGPVAPFDAEIALEVNVVDEDAIAFATNPFRVGDTTPAGGIAFSTSNEMRWGRLAMDNAFGSELSPLPIPLRAEIFDGVGFIPNVADSCTSIPLASIGTTARNPAALATAPQLATPQLVNGDAGLSLTAPGAPGTVDLLVNLDGAPVVTPWGILPPAGLPWLQYDWSGGGAGPHDDNPTGQATFGIHGGDRPVIFRRELY